MTLYDESGRVVERQRRGVRQDARPGGRSQLDDDGAWRDRAACLGMDAAVFYPHAIHGTGYGVAERHKGGAQTAKQLEALELQERPAKAICASCGVREECLAFAVETGQGDGIWGGMNARERERVRREGVGR